MKKELSFTLIKNQHVLVPNDPISQEGQEMAFNYLIQMQLTLINAYNTFRMDNKFKLSNNIGDFFVRVFLNGDGAVFRGLVGYEHKGLMTYEELKNIKRDFNIALKKVENKEFRMFLLLDLIPSSNRRADAIIITNDYKIELFDFSEGVVVDKINKGDVILSKSELKQKMRKDKQQKRIDSFKNNIHVDCTTAKGIIVDDKVRDISYFNVDASFYDFNLAYEQFKNEGYQKIYIPNSLCFLLTKKDVDGSFFVMPLKYNIDSPFFMTSGKPFIRKDFIDDIYNNNFYIGVSILYAEIFIKSFTHFNIKFNKKPQEGMEQNHFYVLRNKKKRYIYLVDTRTNKWLPIGFGFLEKHMFSNIDLESMIIYLAKACNKDNDDDFAKEIIKYEELKNSKFGFFIL